MDNRSEEIFAGLGPSILREASARYGIPPGRLHRLGSFESFVFEYETDGRVHILKVVHRLHRTRELVMGELDWVAYLSHHGLGVSRVVPSRNGEWREVIDGTSVAALGDDYFVVYALEKARGRLMRPDDWDDDLIRSWGRIVGKMHALSKAYQPGSISWRRFAWCDKEFQQAEGQIGSDTVVLDKYRRLMDRMHTWPRDAGSYGLIHSDLHHGNFFVDAGAITAFDFDDCHYGWFGFDIMIPLFYALCDCQVKPDDSEFARWFMECFLSGYAGENSIDGVWIRRIPDFLKFREFDIYAIIRSGNLAEENEWCRRFIAGRRERIEHEVPFIDLDFSEFV